MRLGAGGGGTCQADAAGRGPAAAGEAAGAGAGVRLGLLERDQVVAVGKADLLLGLLFVNFLLVRDLVIGGNAETRAAFRALPRLALQASRPVQSMAVRAKELDLLLGRGRGTAGLGAIVVAIFLRFFVLFPYFLGLRDAELGARTSGIWRVCPRDLQDNGSCDRWGKGIESPWLASGSREQGNRSSLDPTLSGAEKQ